LIAITIRNLINDAHARFKRTRLAFDHSTTNTQNETIYLVLHALRLPPKRLTPFLPRHVTTTEHKHALRLITERIRRRIPAAYLTREAWLGDYRFYVNRHIIVPRSYIAELLRERLAPWIARPARIKRTLDLCTSSGCLAVVLAKTFPTAQVDAVDISHTALAVTRHNVATYHLLRHLRLLQADLFSALHNERYDLIITNPPYVATRIMHELPHEYRHEPQLALTKNNNDLNAMRMILRQTAQHLTAAKLLIIEIGHNRKQLKAIFPHLPFV